MRTFTCVISDAGRGTRAETLVLAQSDERACELARRELLRTPDGVCAEVVEDGRVIAVLQGAGPSGDPDARNTTLSALPHMYPGSGFAPLHAAILRAFNGRGRRWGRGG